MPLQLAKLKPLPKLYRLLPLMPAIFLAYLTVMIILPLPTQLFNLLFDTLLSILIAFNLFLILQYGFTLSKLIGDTTFRRILLASLAATYIVMLVLPMTIFLTRYTEMGVELAFTVIGLEAFVGAILVAVAIIVSRSTALIAVAAPAVLTATMLLASAILISIGKARLALAPLAAPQLAIFHSLFNQPFASALLLAYAYNPLLYRGIMRDVVLESWGGLIVTSILLAFAYTPGILSLATLSWLAYKAYKVTGKAGFKYAAIAITLEAVIFLILSPHITITLALAEISDSVGGFIFLIAMTSILLLLEQAVKWGIAIQPLKDS